MSNKSKCLCFIYKILDEHMQQCILKNYANFKLVSSFKLSTACVPFININVKINSNCIVNGFRDAVNQDS